MTQFIDIHDKRELLSNKNKHIVSTHLAYGNNYMHYYGGNLAPKLVGAVKIGTYTMYDMATMLQAIGRPLKLLVNVECFFTLCPHPPKDVSMS